MKMDSKDEGPSSIVAAAEAIESPDSTQNAEVNKVEVGSSVVPVDERVEGPIGIFSPRPSRNTRNVSVGQSYLKALTSQNIVSALQRRSSEFHLQDPGLSADAAKSSVLEPGSSSNEDRKLERHLVPEDSPNVHLKVEGNIVPPNSPVDLLKVEGDFVAPTTQPEVEDTTAPPTAQLEDEDTTAPPTAQLEDEDTTAPPTAQLEVEDTTAPPTAQLEDEDTTAPPTAQAEFRGGAVPDVIEPDFQKNGNDYERKAFFYISSSSLKGSKDNSETSSVSGDYQMPSEGPSKRIVCRLDSQEPLVCLGSQRCHYIVAGIALITAVIGCAVYALSDSSTSPELLKTVGASTACISFIVGVSSFIYITYLSNYPQLLPVAPNYELLGDVDSVMAMDRISNTQYATTCDEDVYNDCANGTGHGSPQDHPTDRPGCAEKESVGSQTEVKRCMDCRLLPRPVRSTEKFEAETDVDTETET